MQRTIESARKTTAVLLAIFYGWISLGAAGLHTHSGGQARRIWGPGCVHSLPHSRIQGAGEAGTSLACQFVGLPPAESDPTPHFSSAGRVHAADHDACQACRILSLRVVAAEGYQAEASLPNQSGLLATAGPVLPSRLASLPQCRSPPFAA